MQLLVGNLVARSLLSWLEMLGNQLSFNPFLVGGQVCKYHCSAPGGKRGLCTQGRGMFGDSHNKPCSTSF